MRVGLVIYGGLETVSGGYLFDRKLVEYLRSRGDTVEMVSQSWGAYPRRLAQNWLGGWRQRLARLEVDVLVQDELNHPSLFALNRRLRRETSFPLVGIVHHLRVSESHPAALMPFYRAVERRYLAGLDGFIFNSRTTRQSVEDLLSRPTHGAVVTPAGDRFEGLNEAQVTARSRRAGALRLLFVGNLIERKGLHTVIEALGRLPCGSCVLRVVGRESVDPRYSDRLRRQVRRLGLGPHVVFLGGVSDADLEQELRDAQVLVMPSQHEGFGIVYLEGMHFGLPALASTQGAAGEIVRDGQEGRLIHPEDVEGAASWLSALAADRERLERLSLAARRRFADFMGWEAGMASARSFLETMIRDGALRSP